MLKCLMATDNEMDGHLWWCVVPCLMDRVINWGRVWTVRIVPSISIRVTLLYLSGYSYSIKVCRAGLSCLDVMDIISLET